VSEAVDGGMIPPHLSSEFFIWLWFSSEEGEGSISFGEEESLESIEYWIEDKISFRNPDAHKMRAVVLGENASNSLEARAALASGKVVNEIQLHLRYDERDYSLRLSGPLLDLSAVKFPPHSGDADDGLLFERMYHYEELWQSISLLYRHFAALRSSETWTTTVLPRMRAWVGVADSS
jgi:hypothetical protein